MTNPETPTKDIPRKPKENDSPEGKSILGFKPVPERRIVCDFSNSRRLSPSLKGYILPPLSDQEDIPSTNDQIIPEREAEQDQSSRPQPEDTIPRFVFHPAPDRTGCQFSNAKKDEDYSNGSELLPLRDDQLEEEQ